MSISSATNTEEFPLLNRIYWGEEDFLVMSYKARGQEFVLSSPFTLQTNEYVVAIWAKPCS